VVQRDENHSVPGQGCRKDVPIPPNCNSVKTHTSVLPLPKAVQQTQTCFRYMKLAPYTSTSWQWISAGDVPFSRRNLITLLNSMFGHVSARPAILQLMLGQYDWYEARSSVRERKQCSNCSDLARNLNEIRNITQRRGFVTLFIESPSYCVFLNRSVVARAIFYVSHRFNQLGWNFNARSGPTYERLVSRYYHQGRQRATSLWCLFIVQLLTSRDETRHAKECSTHELIRLKNTLRMEATISWTKTSMF
jgi:hypothetical protein